jgi:hypothetical protein
MKIVIPNSLNEITLGQYQEFYKLNDVEDVKVVERRMIEIFCQVPMKYVNQMKAIDVKEIIQILTSMLENKPSLVNLFKMDGVEYGFIPDLDDMTFGEYVDLDTFIGDTNNLHRAMNVLYRPVKIKRSGRYQIEDYDSDKYERMLNMPMDAVISSILFFYHLGIDLSQIMMDYSKMKNEKNMMQYLISEENGDGINHSFTSLKTMLDDLRISLN